jgi:hypothetical protein
MLSASLNGIKEIFFVPMTNEAFLRSTLLSPGTISKTYFPSLVMPTRFFVSWFRLTPLSFEASEVRMVSGLWMNLCHTFFDSRNSSSVNQLCTAKRNSMKCEMSLAASSLIGMHKRRKLRVSVLLVSLRAILALNVLVIAYDTSEERKQRTITR